MSGSHYTIVIIVDAVMKKIIHLLSKQLVRCILGYGRFIGVSACGDSLNVLLSKIVFTG